MGRRFCLVILRGGKRDHFFEGLKFMEFGMEGRFKEGKKDSCILIGFLWFTLWDLMWS